MSNHNPVDPSPAQMRVLADLWRSYGYEPFVPYKTKCAALRDKMLALDYWQILDGAEVMFTPEGKAAVERFQTGAAGASKD